MASIPPPPMDDPSVKHPLECPPLRWGIISCGRIAHDFTQALKLLPTATTVACAARSSDSAKKFADKHGIKKFYGSYDRLLQDEEIDIVYVGNVHSFRRAVGEKVLMANKHCLLEKPFACSRVDAEYLVSLAKERNLFLMEGMWTKFFPAVEQARRLASGAPDDDTATGTIGEVVQVHSDFNFNAADSEEYPSSFVYNHGLGGGACLLVSPYPISAAMLFFGGAAPDQIKAVGQLDTTTGVDLQASVVLNFSHVGDLAPAMDKTNTEENTPKLPGAGFAMLSFGMLGESKEETTVFGTKGRLKICSPGHCPTKLVASIKNPGRGNVTTEVYEYALPEDTDRITEAGGYFYPNSAGLAYEAAAVARCIASGKIEAPQCTLGDTLTNMSIIDEARQQLGVKPIP